MLWTPLTIDIVVPLSLVNSLSRSARRDDKVGAPSSWACAAPSMNHGLLLKAAISM